MPLIKIQDFGAFLKEGKGRFFLKGRPLFGLLPKGLLFWNFIFSPKLGGLIRLRVNLLGEGEGT